MSERTLTTGQRIRRALAWIVVGALAWNLLFAPILIFALEVFSGKAPTFQPMRLEEVLEVFERSID